MISEEKASPMEMGYEYIDDHHAIQRSTGELVGAHWVQVVDGTISYTPEQQEAYKARKEQEAMKSYQRASNKPLGSYYFANSGTRYKDVSPQTMARLIYLGTFLPFDSNTLQTGKDRQMRKGDIENIMGLSRATFFRFWGEVSGKYLFEDENGYVRIADTFRRGKLPKVRNHTEYQKLYIQSVRTLYKLTPVSKHKHLGYIFQMLPYINVEYNILCFTPDEVNIDAIVPMTVDEFCGVVGVTQEKRLRFIREYSDISFPVHGREERFCSFVFDGQCFDRARIFVNPHILYRGSDWNKVAVLGAFTVSHDRSERGA